MALRKAFCPNCGQPTQIDDTKEFCFCISCGNKIIVPIGEQSVAEPNVAVSEHEPKQRTQTMIEEQPQTYSKNVSVWVPEDKLKEVEFYYKLSADKKEYDNIDAEPTYYLKGQDLLVDLSQQYASDYRVWWELCKPMDFAVVIAGEKSYNPGTINSSYFDKALDLAPLEKKMELIKLHDEYLVAKEGILKEMQAEQEAKAIEEKKRIEEQQKKERAAEEERQKIEHQRQQEAIEREKRERIEAEQKAAVFAQAQQELSQNVWASLASKDYSEIDNSYFQFKGPEGIIIVTFKVVTNVLYLNAFHMDANKNNMAYLDQSIAICFAKDGTAIKYDNKPVTVRGWNPGSNYIQVMANPEGGYMVNNFALVKDANYVTRISKVAKKPFLSFSKIFV